MSDKKIEVVVIYTHNVSKAIRVHELPRPGETVRSTGYSEGTDGAKGTNVAIVLGRLGVPTALVSSVRHGDWLVRGHELLAKTGVDDTFINEYDDPTYTRGAMFIDDNGENMIILSYGRQYVCTEAIDEALDRFDSAKYCVTGYELGELGVRYAVENASRRGLKVLLNPSPVPDCIPDFCNKVEVIVLNEHELIRLLNDETAIDSPEKAKSSIVRFKGLSGCKSVVLTLGEKGYMLLNGERISCGCGVRVENVVDTSGAGDAFLAALTACLAKGMTLESACEWANRYSAVTIQREGTITAYPFLDEAEKLVGYMNDCGA